MINSKINLPLKLREEIQARQGNPKSLPFILLDLDAIEENYRAFREAFPIEVFYSMKVNSHPAVLERLIRFSRYHRKGYPITQECRPERSRMHLPSGGRIVWGLPHTSALWNHPKSLSDRMIGGGVSAKYREE